MKIVCQNEDFEKDMQDLVNLFFDEADQPFSLTHTFKLDGSDVESEIKIEKSNENFLKVLSIPSDFDELRRKSFLKRCFKNQLYEILSKKTNKTLPWGSLTGVRPTKFARDLVERKEIKPHLITESLVRDYHVSMEKAKLAVQILGNQKCIIKNDKLVDLFINIPICPTRCNYCSFISNELWTVKDKVSVYLQCLIKELEAVKKMIAEKAYIIRTIYIGGGTPTVLTAEQLDMLLSKINYPVLEFTVECGRADTITREKLEVLKKHGVTRISINPQTFCEATLKRIGRKTTNKQVFDAYMLAMEFDFVVNMDLIAGLSEERLGIFKRTLSTTLELFPHNITVHTLSVKNAAQIRGQEMKYQSDVPKMVEYAQKTLLENGYKPYYLYRQKHQVGGLENVGYFRDENVCIFNIDSMEDVSSVIAVGAGAISKRVFNLENRIERQPNCKFIVDYIDRIDEMIEKKVKFFS